MYVEGGGRAFSCGGFKFDSLFVYKLKQENNKLNFKAENKFKHTQLFERKIYKLYFLIVFTYFFRALLSPQSMWYAFYHLPTSNCKQNPMAVITDSV